LAEIEKAEQMIPQLINHFWVNGIIDDPAIFRVMAILHPTLLTKNGQVMGDKVLRKFESSEDFTDAEFPSHQKGDDLESVLVGKKLEIGGKLRDLWFRDGERALTHSNHRHG
jgi:hypothetical protein